MTFNNIREKFSDLETKIDEAREIITKARKEDTNPDLDDVFDALSKLLTEASTDADMTGELDDFEREINGAVQTMDEHLRDLESAFNI